MTKQFREYGLEVETKVFADTEEVFVRVYAIEPGKSHPVNPRGDGEHEIWDAPKKVHGLALADLTLRTYIPTPNVVCDRAVTIGDVDCQIDYRDAHFVDLRKARQMAKTLEKIERAIEKAASREPGDVLMAFAKAIGATKTVICTGGSKSSWLNQAEWEFHPIEKARDLFRVSVAGVVRKRNYELTQRSYEPEEA